EEKQLELEEHNEETFPNNDINYILDINADNSFGQVSKSSASNVSQVSNLRNPICGSKTKPVFLNWDRTGP
ncbi:6497_t:CDS:2, partial [Dentiscutata erythropus]